MASVSIRDRIVAGAIWLTLAAAAADDGVAARVNGTPISDATVRDVVRGVIKAQRTPPSSEEIAKLNDASIESLIELELLYQDALARGMTVSDAEVTAEIQRTRARFKDAQQYDAALARSGLSDAALRADTRKTLLVDRLLTEVVWKDIRIDPADAQRFYDENRALFVRDGQQLSYAEAEASIQRVLREDEQRRRQGEYVARLRQSAKIEKPTP
jgi:peptidyl-prolyl cis-trans isomerase C